MKKSSGILWGLVLVALGLLLGSNALGITDIDLFFDGWWTLLIIVPSAIGLVTEKNKWGYLIALLAGIVALLCCQGLINLELIWSLALPAVIILVGLKLILDAVFKNRTSGSVKKIKSGNIKTATAVFSSQYVNCSGENVEGIELNAIFGSVECDLRNAVIENDCVINVSSIFGGADIYVPDNVNVQVKSMSLFGGVSNKKNPSNENAVTVYIHATCMFGGTDIK